MLFICLFQRHTETARPASGYVFCSLCVTQTAAHEASWASLLRRRRHKDDHCCFILGLLGYVPLEIRYPPTSQRSPGDPVSWEVSDEKASRG